MYNIILILIDGFLDIYRESSEEKRRKSDANLDRYLTSYNMVEINHPVMPSGSPLTDVYGRPVNLPTSPPPIPPPTIPEYAVVNKVKKSHGQAQAANGIATHANWNSHTNVNTFETMSNSVAAENGDQLGRRQIANGAVDYYTMVDFDKDKASQQNNNYDKLGSFGRKNLDVDDYSRTHFALNNDTYNHACADGNGNNIGTGQSHNNSYYDTMTSFSVA
jgi:hypothetical protein